MDEPKHQRRRHRNSDRGSGNGVAPLQTPIRQLLHHLRGGGHIVASPRPFINAIMSTQQLQQPCIPVPVPLQQPVEENEKMYMFTNFPIEMDDTVFNIAGKYSVALLHIPRYNVIFIRTKWRDMQSAAMCAMITFGSSEEEIRVAAEECTGNLERFEHLVRNGARYPVSRCSIPYLTSHHIVVMDKVNESFPDAIYWCSLCDFHMTNIQHVRSHFETHQHFPEEQRQRERQDLLERMPEMTPKQLAAINLSIASLFQEDSENGRGPLWQQRQELAKSICELLSRNVFEKMGVEGQISLYGSTLTKTCTEKSDLNLAIDIPKIECSDAVETMRRVTDLLNLTSDVFDAQFSADVPMCIKLNVSNVWVRITWKCENGVKLGKLLSVYTTVRPQFAELCRIVRKWAEVSAIYTVDRRQGGLSTYGFDLMVLYFMQQIGLLPCLHEMRPVMSHENKTQPMIDDFYEYRDLYESDIDAIVANFGASEESWDMGSLFVKFLRFYASREHQNEVVQVYTSKQVLKDRSRWNRKLLQISDPFRTDNVVTFTKAYQAYFFNCFLTSYVYFATPQTCDERLLDITLYQKMGESPRKKKGKRRKGPDPAKANSTMTTPVPKPLFVRDIEDAEYTAAADAVVEEEEEDEKIKEEILRDMMPVVVDASCRPSGSEEVVGVDKDDSSAQPQRTVKTSVKIGCLSGIRLCAKSFDNAMAQLAASTDAGVASVACSVVDLPARSSGSFVLPSGHTFFLPKRSACGFLVANSWVEHVVEINRLKKGLCEMILAMPTGGRLVVLQCIGLCESYPIRRLLERLKYLETKKDSAVIVLFGTEEKREKKTFNLYKSLKKDGLVFWKGSNKNLAEKSGSAVVSCAKNSGVKLVEVVHKVLGDERADFVIASVEISQAGVACQPNLIKNGTAQLKKAEAVELVETMERAARRKERKIKRVERRRLEKEQVAQVLEGLIKRVCLSEAESSNDGTSADRDNGKKQRHVSSSAHSVANELPQENCRPTTSKEPIAGRASSPIKEVRHGQGRQGSTAVANKPAKNRKERNRKGKKNDENVDITAKRVLDDVINDVVESLQDYKEDTSVVMEDYNENGIEKAKRRMTVGENTAKDVLDDIIKNVLKSLPDSEEYTSAVKDDYKENGAVHNILLKDLTPEDVEIDDPYIYSRRTMYRIRKSNPMCIRRSVFDTLDRYGIARRHFKERDEEVDQMSRFQREVYLHECKREEMRSKISQRRRQDSNPFDLVTSGVTEEDWNYDAGNDNGDVEINNAESADEAEETAESAEANNTAEVTQAMEKVNVQDNSCDAKRDNMQRICYEDFFITFKRFDPYSLREKVEELSADQFHYSFEDAKNFNNGYKPDIVCATCESSDHWTDVCPMMTIPTLETITHRKEPCEWVELENVIMGGYEKNRIKDDKVDEVAQFVERMRSYLHKELNKPLRLQIFGSLISGFGVLNSDVDLCFRFQADEQPLDVDGVEIVKQIALHLQQMKEVDRVYAITGAKVPIVKFVWTKRGIEGDISYYNVLALSNTEMLKTYCSWDDRVAPLGVWIKRWAKVCDIGDASRGSLSSYAFIILLIHYLQNCYPPVLPRLQEDFRDDDTKPEIVENCDVYFHHEVTSGWSKNKQSVGELFVGFLDYYAKFDFGSQVVQIRRSKPLLKLEKDWNRSMCIEDPFDLRHNLGSGVTKKMFVFILRNIHNSRKRFMLSDVRKAFLKTHGLALGQEIPQKLVEVYGTALLRDCQMGTAPTDRQCRICHRVGHFAESCQKNTGQRTTRRSDYWSKKGQGGSEGYTPRSSHSFGQRSNATVGERVFYRKGERPRGGMKQSE